MGSGPLQTGGWSTHTRPRHRDPETLTVKLRGTTDLSSSPVQKFKYVSSMREYGAGGSGDTHWAAPTTSRVCRDAGPPYHRASEPASSRPLTHGPVCVASPPICIGPHMLGTLTPSILETLPCPRAAELVLRCCSAARPLWVSSAPSPCLLSPERYHGAPLRVSPVRI